MVVPSQFIFHAICFANGLSSSSSIVNIDRDRFTSSFFSDRLSRFSNFRENPWLQYRRGFELAVYSRSVDGNRG